ncbi:MAG: hypothetical protein KZQ82_03415, partial [Candidatus Thiodiazotropha sp. (ex Lucinoma annulata)]|nr:hypothetical protein [Candidatus Thiodiazotropha sp. (ex Lucinoma annulata)]
MLGGEVDACCDIAYQPSAFGEPKLDGIVYPLRGLTSTMYFSGILVKKEISAPAPPLMCMAMILSDGSIRRRTQLLVFSVLDKPIVAAKLL